MISRILASPALSVLIHTAEATTGAQSPPNIVCSPADDPAELRSALAQDPEIVAWLNKLLVHNLTESLSKPGTEQPNDQAIKNNP